MTDYQGYLIDLDGTTYFGTKRIPSAEKFINALIDQQFPFQFVTNNATQSVAQIKDKLNQHYGIRATEEMIYTSVMAMIDYLKAHHPGETIYCIGEPSFKEALKEAGFELTDNTNASLVVQALNRQTTYQELQKAVTTILNGAEFLVTNTDTLLPTAEGMIPSSGALTAFIQFASGKTPVIMGKPHIPLTQGALDRLGLEAQQCLMIGDNYNTDIKAGIDANMDTLLVLTGVTQREDLSSLPIQPTYVVEDLSQWPLPQ